MNKKNFIAIIIQNSGSILFLVSISINITIKKLVHKEVVGRSEDLMDNMVITVDITV